MDCSVSGNASPSPKSNTAGRRPNVLFITCDQWRGDCLSAAGHPVVKTPNADALASEGVLFRRHYAGAAPCSPARACIYTGLYQMTNRVCQNGTPMDHRHWNIALAARALGYDPTLFGYTDVAPDPRERPAGDPALRTYEGFLPGFTVRQALPEHQKQWLSWLKTRGVDATAPFPDIHRPAGNGHPEVSRAVPIYGRDETPSAFMAGEFIRWLGEQDEPWFAHISFLSPHPPFIVPAPFNEMYGDDQGPTFHRAKNWQEEAASHPFLDYAMRKMLKHSFIPGRAGLVRDWSEQEFRTIRALYYGMISEVDSQLGRIWEGLRSAGAWDDTVIVLTSDHAEMMGDHFMLGKGGYFDQSYHLPLIIKANGAAAGVVVDRFTEAVDLAPTILELAGGDSPNWLDGRSLSPFLHGEMPGDWRDCAHWEYDFRSVSERIAEQYFGLPSQRCNLSVIRSERYKYVHFAGLPPLLFDLQEDPGELRNVAQDGAYRDVRLEYAERLLAWRAEHLEQRLALVALTDKGVVSQQRE
ncbi:alkaline phosphatase family protein [Pseudaminobacter sp. 19-2017]|uniref:Alkaline phosphatase family protein n=1 Tax=Pseudaminobacter soli (ex Zhang et al. 2022) TaxID=2831468 RepID=A0A942E3Y7_9HYPH|nr:alkaline phosphatase family protein [Pseudaminobacter soli]